MKQQGFSLTEVLISLLIVSCTGMLFLKQHWTIERLYQQMSLRQRALFLLDDLSEKRFSSSISLDSPDPFQIRVIPHEQQAELQIIWPQTKKAITRNWF